MHDSAFDLLTEKQLRDRNTIKWNFFEPDVLPMWVAEMDYPTAPPVLEGIRVCVENEEFGYPRFNEDTLAAATAGWCRRRYGWQVQPDWIRAVPDVLKGMETVVNFLTRPESPVEVDDGFHSLEDVPTLQQDSGRYVLDLDALEAAFVRGAGSSTYRPESC